MAQSAAPTHMQGAAMPWAQSLKSYWLLIALVLGTLAVITAAPSALGVDGTIHIWMVDAMVNHGHLHIAERGGVADSSELLTLLSHPMEGRVMPQYPSGYALLAAPFYWAFGIHGLLWMNALSFVVVLWATRRIAFGLYGDETMAWMAAGLTGLASLLPGYVFIVLPHMSSLALTLVAAERCLAASRQGAARPGLALVLAGLALGTGLNLRVDVILPTVALFIWIRLFGLPSARLKSLGFLLGLAPGLLLASFLNDAKFGTFVPLSYGPKGGSDGIANYAAFLTGLGLVLAAMMAFDVSRPRIQSALNRLIKWVTPKRALWALGALTLAVLALEPARTLVFNIYVLAINLQSASDWQVLLGLTRDEYGFASFYGLNKKALLQSMPFAVLLAVVIWDVVRGRNLKAHALGGGVLASVLLFYGAPQWHGGLGMNMRYFIPAVPFVCIFSAYAVWTLFETCPASKPRAKQLRLGILMGAGILVMAGLSGTWTPMYKLAVFYGPLLVAAGLLAAIILLLAKKRESVAAPAFGWLLAVSLGQAAAVGLSDAAYYHARLAGTHSSSQATLEAFPQDTLVVSSVEELFLDAKIEGLYLVNPRPNRDSAIIAAGAHLDAGRCVYLHGIRARGPVADALGGDWVTVTLPGQTGPMAEFDVRVVDLERCALTS